MRVTELWLLAAFVLLPGVSWPQASSGQPPASPARPIEAWNRRTPDWLEVDAAYRFRTEIREGEGYGTGPGDLYGLSRLLVDVEIEPTGWLHFQFQGQDSRAPGKQNATPPFRDPFDVRQAWVRFGDPERNWSHVTVGRQELKYGAQRLVGPLDWTNTARQFDAAKLTMGREDLSVDIFSASVVRIDDKAFNRRADGANLHGVYARFDRWAGQGALEAYTFWKTDPLVPNELGGNADSDLFTSGLRVARPLPRGFDLEVEMAVQFGDHAGDDVAAWGGYWIGGYRIPGPAWKPRLSLEYQYGSGDSDPRDGRAETFNQLFPTGHLYQGVADRVGWRNIHDVRGGVQLEPRKGLALTFDYFAFWLASRSDHLYGVAGNIVVRAPTGGAERSFVGSEFDGALVRSPLGSI